MVFALHRDRPTQDWDSHQSERCRRVWWTVYILDRTFSSSMGVPIAIQDSDITAPLPMQTSSQKSAALFVHVKVSSLISEVINSKYSEAHGRNFQV